MRIFEQTISSGNNADGTDPGTTPAIAGDVEKRWPVATHGGLFDFTNRGTVQLCMIQILMGGQTTWTLNLVDDENVSIVLWSGTTDTAFVALEADKVRIHRGMKLAFITTGVTNVNVKIRLGTEEVP